MPEEGTEPQIAVENVCENPCIEEIHGDAKDFVQMFLKNIRYKDFYYQMGINPDKTFLLYGVPATGKSISIKVINNEANKDVSPENQMDFRTLNLLTVPYDIGRYGTAYVNRGSKIIQHVFDFAYASSQVGKDVLLVLDEADALFMSRTNSASTRTGEDLKNLETLMKNMQQAHDTPGVYVALITNLEKFLDAAAVRSGRIDKKIEFKLPNEEQRRSAIQGKIDTVNQNAGYKVIRKYNVDQLVEESDGMNYADIDNAIVSSVKERIDELLDREEDSERLIRAPHITQKRLLAHMQALKPQSRTVGFHG